MSLAAEEKAFAAERAVAGIRVLIIAFNSLVYQFLLPKDPRLAPLAYSIVVAIGGRLARETQRQLREKLEVRGLADALRDSEERLRRLSDAALEGIAIHEHGRILEANRAFAGLFGYASAKDVLGKDAFELF